MKQPAASSLRVAFFHGLGQTPDSWQAVLEHSDLGEGDCRARLAADAVPQLPATDKDAGALSVDCPNLYEGVSASLAYCDLVEGLEAVYADSPVPLVLCGLSLGAVLAIDYALRHPQQVAGLVLVGGQYKMPAKLLGFQNLLFRCLPKRAFADMGLPKQTVIGLTASMREIDFSGELNKIACPVKVVCGGKDRANLTASREMSRLLPNAQLHVVPGVGHEVNREAPQALAAIVDELVGEARGAACDS